MKLLALGLITFFSIQSFAQPDSITIPAGTALKIYFNDEEYSNFMGPVAETSATSAEYACKIQFNASYIYHVLGIKKPDDHVGNTHLLKNDLVLKARYGFKEDIYSKTHSTCLEKNQQDHCTLEKKSYTHVKMLENEYNRILETEKGTARYHCFGPETKEYPSKYSPEELESVLKNLKFFLE